MRRCTVCTTVEELREFGEDAALTCVVMVMVVVVVKETTVGADNNLLQYYEVCEYYLSSRRSDPGRVHFRCSRP